MVGGRAVVSVTSLVVLCLITPPSHFVTASADPAEGLWIAIGCVIAGVALRFAAPAYRRCIDPVVGIAALYVLSLGILDLAERTFGGSIETDFERGHVAVSVLWTLIGLGLLITGLIRDSRLLRYGGLTLFGLSLAKIFLYDLSALNSVARALSFIVVGGLVLVGGFFLQRLSAPEAAAAGLKGLSSMHRLPRHRRAAAQAQRFRLDRPHDCAVHAVGHLVREGRRDVRRARPPRGPGVLASESAPAMQPTQAPRSARSSGVSWSSATTSLMPIRPPGLSTREISASTGALSVDRLTTQFEITTSTVSAGQRDVLDLALEELDFVAPASAALVREREHLLGHVEPVGLARRADPAWRTAARRCRRPSRGRARSRPRAARRPRSGCRSPGSPWRLRRGARPAARRRTAPRRTSSRPLPEWRNTSRSRTRQSRPSRRRVPPRRSGP